MTIMFTTSDFFISHPMASQNVNSIVGERASIQFRFGSVLLVVVRGILFFIENKLATLCVCVCVFDSKAIESTYNFIYE